MVPVQRSLILGRAKKPQEEGLSAAFRPDASGLSPAEVVDRLGKLVAAGEFSAAPEQEEERCDLIRRAVHAAEKHRFLAAAAAQAFRGIARHDQAPDARWEALYCLSVLGENDVFLRKTAVEALNAAARNDADPANRQVSRLLAARFTEMEQQASSPVPV